MENLRRSLPKILTFYSRLIFGIFNATTFQNVGENGSTQISFLYFLGIAINFWEKHRNGFLLLFSRLGIWNLSLWYFLPTKELVQETNHFMPFPGYLFLGKWTQQMWSELEHTPTFSPISITITPLLFVIRWQ